MAIVEENEALNKLQQKLRENQTALWRKARALLCARISEVISRRNKQFACLMGDLFNPEEIIRLSNYPQQNDISKKLPFTLVFSSDLIPGTPWHHTPIVVDVTEGSCRISMQHKSDQLNYFDEKCLGLPFPIRWATLH